MEIQQWVKLLSSFVLAFVVVEITIGNDGHVTALVGEEDDKSDDEDCTCICSKEIRNVEVQVEEGAPG